MARAKKEEFEDSGDISGEYKRPDAAGALKIYKNERGKGFTVENKVVGGTIPKEYINACKAGVEEAMLNGIIAGYPVVDVGVDLIDGSSHEVDSNENAFKMAAIFAVKDALKKAKCILLEPIMGVECSTPEQYQGDLLGDLNRRRGRIQGMDTKNTLCVLRAEVPAKVNARSIPLLAEAKAIVGNQGRVTVI